MKILIKPFALFSIVALLISCKDEQQVKVEKLTESYSKYLDSLTLEKSEDIKDSTKFKVFSSLDNLFGLNLFTVSTKKDLDQHSRGLLEKRALARSSGDFVESDRLRDELVKLGIAVKDNKEGQSWDWLI